MLPLAFKRSVVAMVARPALGRVLRAARPAATPGPAGPYLIPETPDFDRVRARLLFGVYESAERRMVRRHAPGHRCAVDLGASLGVVSTVAARAMGAGAALVCVEPNPRLSGHLRTWRTWLEREADVKIELVGAAVAYSGPQVTFAASEDNVIGRVANLGNMTVPTVRLGTLVERLRSGAPCLLVADVEGQEHHVVDAEPEALRAFDTLIIEVHGAEDDARRFGAKVVALGFEQADRDGQVHVFRRAVR